MKDMEPADGLSEDEDEDDDGGLPDDDQSFASIDDLEGIIPYPLPLTHSLT